MGPIALFDKSFLQSLSLDESVWFDAFYSANIVPLFYIETLSDLEKAIKNGRTPEQEVGIIADKTPERSSSPNTFHQTLIVGNLLGYKLVMDGRPILSGGRAFRTGDKKAIMFEYPPEQEAFSRWQKGEFLDLERQFARTWRRFLGPFNFAVILQIFNSIGIQPKSHSLEEAKRVADAIIEQKTSQETLLVIGLKVFNITDQQGIKIYKNWNAANKPTLKEFAPYFTYCLTIEIFFHIAITSNLIPQEVNSKTDFAYLYYLPFCMVFVSSDRRVHKRCAPLFLRDDQEFVWGPDLKEDLKKIDAYFDALPESEKEEGLYKIATYPPGDKNLITTRLWDKYLTLWRKHKDEPEIITDEAEKKRLIDHITGLTKGEAIPDSKVDFDINSVDGVVLKRKVRKRKGKWWQLPKNLREKSE
jgi:hypothetical protein